MSRGGGGVVGGFRQPQMLEEKWVRCLVDDTCRTERPESFNRHAKRRARAAGGSGGRIGSLMSFRRCGSLEGREVRRRASVAG